MRDPLFAADRAADWVVLSATSAASARDWAERAGLTGATFMDPFSLARGGFSKARRSAGGVVIHSRDWSREEMPQLHLVAAAALAPWRTYLVDEAGSPEPVLLRPRAVLGGAAAALPQAAMGLGRSALEVARARRAPGEPAWPPGSPPESVLAPWSGSLGGDVGGSVTHAAGILGGMRDLGLRVHLVSELPPPDQIAAAVDQVHVLPGAPASHRLTREVRRLTGNGPFRARLAAALTRLDAPMIYSRHQAMATAAADVAGSAGVPLALEWNASERWAIENWTRMPAPVKRLAAPAIDVTERSVVRRASVVAAVSGPAADMALEAGAAPERVIVAPNAADPAAIDAVVGASAPPRREGEPPLVGWIGTFGAWHGARCLIEALARAGSAPRALLIGDGVERPDAERRAAELGIAERVEFTGRLGHDDALRRLAGCDILASPTMPLGDGRPFFGSPTKIFEYMALGRAIVASRLGQIEEVLEHGRTGLLVPPGSAPELAGAIDRLAQDETERLALGREARRELEGAHTWRHRARTIIDAVAGA